MLFWSSPDFLSSEISVYKMRGELETLLKLLHQVEEDRGAASLTITTRGGKTAIKFTTEFDETAPPTASTAPGPQPRQQRRNRGRAARRKANARAAQHRATEATPSSPTNPGGDSSDPPRRPLQVLPSPVDERRRQVITVERPAGESFDGLNMDGSPPSEDNDQNETTCKPPACLIDCNIQVDHCEHCQRCFELCKEHSGCRCEPEPGSEPWDCVICEGPEYAYNAVANIYE